MRPTASQRQSRWRIYWPKVLVPPHTATPADGGEQSYPEHHMPPRTGKLALAVGSPAAFGDSASLNGS